VLLIDELDRTDEPFEAYLLEVLSDFQITIPEWKTVKAERPPVVVITSNRTREIHDAVKRRCLYHWVDYPSAAREFEIIRRKVPDASEMLSAQIVRFVQSLRSIELYKLPGVAETIEWTRALLALDAVVLEPEVVNNTLGVLLKYQDDIAKMQGSEAAQLVERVRRETARLNMNPAATRCPAGWPRTSWIRARAARCRAAGRHRSHPARLRRERCRIERPTHSVLAACPVDRAEHRQLFDQAFHISEGPDCRQDHAAAVAEGEGKAVAPDETAGSANPSEPAAAPELAAEQRIEIDAADRPRKLARPISTR
jgi:hypothetical protein